MRSFISGVFAGGTLVALFAFAGGIPDEPAGLIQLDKMNVFYAGLDNPVSILVRGVPENEVRITTSENLTIKKETGLSYTVRAGTPGEGSITLSGGRLKPVTFQYRVKRIPDPVPLLGAARGSCLLGNGEFKAQGGIAAVWENLDIEARCDMVSYRVVHLRKNVLMAEATNNGARFEPEVRAIVDEARSGDVYIFDEIKTRCPGDQATRNLGSLTFVIK